MAASLLLPDPDHPCDGYNPFSVTIHVGSPKAQNPGLCFLSKGRIDQPIASLPVRPNGPRRSNLANRPVRPNTRQMKDHQEVSHGRF